MKVLLLTYGTRGDVQPFVALATRLKVAGHDVTMAASTSSAGLIKSRDIPLVPIHERESVLSADPRFARAFRTGFRGVSGRLAKLRAIYHYRGLMAGVNSDMAAAAFAAGADVVVHHALYPGHEIAESLGVPAVPVCVQPAWIRTSSFTSPFLPYQLPVIFNRLSYWTADLMRLRLQPNTARWRSQELGLPRRRGHRNPFRNSDGTPRTVLQSTSKVMLPAPLDYPDWVHTTGFWFLPPSTEWTPPRELSDFLQAGKPPVYVGFGSITNGDPRRFGRIVAQAVRRAGVRAIVVAGWGAIHPDEFGEDTLHLNDVPLDWLLPRTAATIHHGGNGTTGAALAAGRPQVVCPLRAERMFFARRVHACSVSPPPLRQDRLTVQALASAIETAVSDERLRERASELGRCVRAEDGVSNAVEIIEREVS